MNVTKISQKMKKLVEYKNILQNEKMLYYN